MGLYEDTGISKDQFALLALIFYVTYLVFESPTGYLMQRLPTAKYLGANGRWKDWRSYDERRLTSASDMLGPLCNTDLCVQEFWFLNGHPGALRVL